MEMTRSTFIKGSVAAGAGVALMGTVSAAAAADEAESQFGTSPVVAEPIPDDQIIETLDADIVVVGLGHGGSVAAVTAAEEGASVVVFQKASGVYCPGVASSWPKSQVMDADGISYDPWEIVNTNLRGLVANRCNTKLWRNWVKYGEEIANWWIDFANADEELGPVMSEYAFMGENAGWADETNKFNENFITAHIPMGAVARFGEFGTMRTIYERMLAAAIAGGANIDIRYETPGVQLVTDDTGAVVGAIGKSADGYIKANAAKGVILATGGYINNPMMREKYMPFLSELPPSLPEGYDTGDGLFMGELVGGVVTPAPHAGCVHYDPAPVGIPTHQGTVVPWLSVNILGERFCNEDMGYALVSMQDTLQPKGIHFQVFDDNYAVDIKTMGQGTQFGDWETMVPESVENGTIYVGDTLEELAEAMGVPVDTFVATVARYNELVEAGYDDDYGKQAGRLKAIAKPPFYAFIRQPSIQTSLGGLIVDEDYRVLNAEKVPIPGLFAVGSNFGGMFGGIQYPMFNPGISVARCILSGRIAAWRACGKTA